MKYDEYKPSGLPWVIFLPKRWELRRAKFMYRKENRPVRDKDGVVTCFRDGMVTLRSKRRTTGFTEAIQENGYQGIRKGDLVIHVMDAFAGAIGVSDSDGKGTPVYNVCTAIGDYNNYYYAHVLRIMAKAGFIQSLYRGIRERSSDFRFEVFAAQALPVPPREEQDHIVRYLDWQVSKINKLIAAKKKEIALIDEHQRSHTYNLVTNGTYTNKKVKSSGINWAEMIPDEWKVLYLSQVANERMVKNTGMIEDNLLSLSYGHIIKKDINSTDGLLPTSFEGYQIVEPGNIVLRLTDLQNDHKSLRVGLSTQKGIITSAYTCLSVHDNILPEYLYLQLHAADLCKVFYGMGGGVRQSIGFKDIRKMLIAVPPIHEQEKIVLAEIESRATTDTLINNLKEEIEKLEELKKSLIFDVVTGQIDVRGFEIPEFEYTEAPLDDATDDADALPEVDEND